MAQQPYKGYGAVEGKYHTPELPHTGVPHHDGSYLDFLGEQVTVKLPIRGQSAAVGAAVDGCPLEPSEDLPAEQREPDACKPRTV